MSGIRGWPDQQKSLSVHAEHVTVSPARLQQQALDVKSHSHATAVEDDTIGAGSTTRVIQVVNTAKKGDIVQFTSGANDGLEAVVYSATGTDITLCEHLPSAPLNGDTCTVLRLRTPRVNGTGSTLSSLTFQLDGVAQEVIEDTVTPANNRPLPVKLTDFTGDVNITAGDLNVQIEHDGPSPASTRVGDGTNLLAISADGAALVGNSNGAFSSDAGAIDNSTQRVTIANDDTVSTGIASMDINIASIEANAAAIAADTTAIAADTTAIAADTTAIAADTAAIASDVSSILSAVKGLTPADKFINDHGSVNVTTAAYTQIVASSAEYELLEIFDSSGSILVVAFGPAASEVDKFYIFPGGNGPVRVKVPAGTRISVKAVDANATSGYLLINAYGV